MKASKCSELSRDIDVFNDGNLNMKNLRLLIVILITFFNCGHSTAGNFSEITGSIFEAGRWSGSAFKDDETGKWAECSVTRSFRNMYSLSFALSPAGFNIYLSYTSRPLFENVDNFQMVSQVDRYEPIFLTARKWNNRWISAAYADFDTIYFQLKKGNKLQLSSSFLGNLSFNLKGSSRALKAAYDCASKYEDYGAPSRRAKGSAATGSTSTFGAIALSETDGSNGYSYQYESRYEAETRALKECRELAAGCVIAGWFENECGALAMGDGNGWGASTGYSIIEAERDAIETCHSYDNRNCEIELSLCSYD